MANTECEFCWRRARIIISERESGKKFRSCALCFHITKRSSGNPWKYRRCNGVEGLSGEALK